LEPAPRHVLKKRIRRSVKTMTSTARKIPPLLLLAASLALAQHANEPNADAGLQNPFRNDPKAITAGAEVFRVQCSACHGAQGEGGSGPALAEGLYGIGNRDEDLRQVVMRGRDVMPGFRNILSEESIWHVVAYVRSLAGRTPANVPGDAAAGGELFWGKGGCAQCHRVGLNGASSGPNLTEIGVRRGAAYLRESLLNPDAGVPRGYAMVTVVTSGGETLQGIRSRSDNFSVQFLDLQGNFHSYLREELKEVAESGKSLMPPYGNALSDAELTDLVAYLSRLGREKRP
jgi:cytochrome c oxidase cbb3-type subunit III